MNTGAEMIKRAFDVIASLAALILLIPFFIGAAIAIKLDSPGPAFYTQYRVGRHGKRFKIVKLRSMVRDANRFGSLTINKDPRITRVGAWLRRRKLDELSTLYNVLLGDMSLVGPRPETTRFVELYNAEQMNVLSVRPGITDLGTLNFDGEAALLSNADQTDEVYLNQILPEKLRLNLEYIERRNIYLDIKIIFMTLLLIVRRRSTGHQG